MAKTNYIATLRLADPKKPIINYNVHEYQDQKEEAFTRKKRPQPNSIHWIKKEPQQKSKKIIQSKTTTIIQRGNEESSKIAKK